MDCLIHYYHLLVSSPRVKAWLERQFLTHLQLYGERVVKLKQGIHNLKKARYAVQHKVNEEENRYDRGIPEREEIEEWIKEVNETISKYEEFIQDTDHEFAAFDFQSGYLPKARMRLHLSKEALNILGKVNRLQETANHDSFSYWLGPISMADFFDNVSYERFSSREKTIEKINESLKSPNVRMIGLHGLSGVGKTTLVKEIAREAAEASEVAKMFDVVAMANVTRNPDIRKIQGQIADTLGMKLDEESDIARAARILKRLKNEKESILIILDDLWATLDLKMLGIPLVSGDKNGENSRTKTTKEIAFGNAKGKAPPEHSIAKIDKNNMMKSKKLPSASSVEKPEETLSYYKGCKVLLISESKQVLLNQMEGKTDSIYFMDVLKEKEAESLFKKMAGISDRNSELEKLASQISNKCNRLPMSIVTTARALKNQSRSVWEDVQRQLERGTLTGTSEFSTKLSYNLLEDEELKYIFLICACMGPDALIMDLVKYCIGLGFLQNFHTVKEGRDRVYVLVGKLKVAGLLTDSYSSDHFTMQDIVRRGALSIASKEKHAFTMTKWKIDEWPDKLEKYATISLHHCHIMEGFPERINYPRLRVFQCNNIDSRLEIPNNFFKGMKQLRVLMLTGIHISPSDSSLASLSELRMLSLEQCYLDKELSVIGELKKLRILSFSGSDIEKLPVELKQLKKLQSFDISNCSKLREVPSNIFSSLTDLEELYMRNTFIQWGVEGQTYPSETACLSELRCLNRLTTLDMEIRNASYLPKNLFFDKLHSYKIVIGGPTAGSEMNFRMPEKYEVSRFLAIQLKNDFAIHSQTGIKMLFERVEHLLLEDLEGVDDIFYRLNLKGFPYLKHLLIVNNSNIESLANPKDRQHRQHMEKAFPKLESLHLYNLENMGKICSCQLSAPSFGKLKIIKINHCGRLSNVFSFSMISLLTVLETIEVSECYALKEIVLVEDQSNTGLLKFPKLRSLTLLSLPELIGFYPIPSTEGEATEVTELFHNKVEVSKLERMVLSSIQIDNIWSHPPLLTSCFHNLIHLDVNDCTNLTYLVSFSMAESLLNLQSLFVSECQKMRHIFSQGNDSYPEGKIFPNLKNIKLSSMKSLEEIWNSKLSSNSFGKLDTLIIEECNKFVVVFPCYVEGMFQSLCNLRVTNCKSLKAVFDLDDTKRHSGEVTNLKDVYLETLPKLELVWKWGKDRVGILELKSLQKLWVRDCDSLENLFPVSVARRFHSLEYVVIWDCFQLREIVAKREGSESDILDSSFEFPKLTTIKFSELPKLTCFCPGDYKFNCPILNDLSIELCDRLEPFRKETTDVQTSSTLFSEEVINKLKSMQIESWHAKSSSSYLGEGNHRQDNLEELCLSRFMNPEILYSFLHRNPNLTSLSLNKCSFIDTVPLLMPSEIKNLGVVPKLKSLKLTDLPDLETIGFEGDIILERIELLVLRNCPLLVNIMPSSVSLTHLTNLEVVNCDGIKKLMPLSAAKSLVQLNSMRVFRCESMEEIIEKDNAEEVGKNEENAGKVDVVFRQLKVIELVSLKKLNCFSKSCVFEFPSLEKLVVSACPKMENFSENVRSTPLLQIIFVVHEKEKKIGYWKDDLNTTIQEIYQEKKFFEGMDELNLSEHHDLQEDWNRDDFHPKKSWFYSLKTLKLENCENLSCAIPYNILLCLKSLKDLKVRNCNKVEVIFGKKEKGTEAISSQLKNLTLDELSELKYVWEKNYQGNHRFQNLQQVSVSNCESVQTLFPVALARTLKKLEKLEITSCKNLLEIIGKEDVAAAVTEKFEFPCLTSLSLYDLPELAYFYPLIFTVEWELHGLLMMLCPKLELFQIACSEGAGESSSTSIIRQPLFSDLKAISTLEELIIDGKYSSWLISKLRQFSEDIKFLVLKDIHMFLDVDDNENSAFPFDILEKAPNLQCMAIEMCSNPRIFQQAQNSYNSEQEILGQLKILRLFDVSKLDCIGLEEPLLNTFYEKVHELYVTDCVDLKKLFHSPSAVSFSCLKQLYLEKCHKLEYLFTSSMAIKLEQLEKITVKECESITRIVENEQEGTTLQGIEFERLYWIDLYFLPKLECFYSGNDTLQLPSLIQVEIWQCPQMEVFSGGEIIANSFRGIQASSYPHDELVFHNGVKDSVKRVFLLQMLSKVMDKESFSKHRELQEAWNGGLSPQDNWFYSLKTMVLDNCAFEQYAIPSNILPCLKKLNHLEVRNCKKVKAIFDMNDNDTLETASQLKYLTLEGLSELTLVWKKNCHGIIRFQNLQQVMVDDCKRMKTLFPLALARKLKMLQKLEIKSCDELQQIVEKEGDAGADVKKKFVFPSLTSLDLYDLPELKYFYPEIFTVEFPRLNNLHVRECPELELFQGAHPEDEGECSSTSINRSPFFSDVKAISILEELSLDWKHISMLPLGLHAEDLKKLNKTTLWFVAGKNKKPTLPIEILKNAPNLREMAIEFCNSCYLFLTSPKVSELLGNLESLTLTEVYQLKVIGSEESSWLNNVCEKLLELNVDACPDLTTFLHSTSTLSFSNLKELSISECPKLNYLFTSSATKKLMHLEKITVENCSSMEKVVAKDNLDKDEAPQVIELKQLRSITLNDLPSLQYFFLGNDILQLPSFKQVKISECPNMQAFSQGSIHAKSVRGSQVSSCSSDDLVLDNQDLIAKIDQIDRGLLPQRVHLVFSGSPWLKEIWFKSETVSNGCFRSLKSLVVEGCEFLSDVILPSHLLPLLSNLNSLEVRKCNSVEAIFVYTKTGPEGSLNLPNLEKLCVENCENLVEIVAKDKTTTGEENEEIIMFPSITFLKLWNLYKLSCIYPEKHILQSSILTELHVVRCPKLKFFATEFHSSHECQGNSLTNQQAFVSLEKVTPCLEALSLSQEESKMIEQGKLHVDFQELNSLIFQSFHDESVEYPFVFHSKALLPSIKKLVVCDSDFKEIFPSQTFDIDCTKILSQLEELELRSLSRLKSIGLDHSWMSPFLENLQTLLVWDCDGLTNLTPSTVSFSNLIKLDIRNCCEFRYLFTSSTAKTLHALRELHIANCKLLKAIVAKEGDEYKYEDENQDVDEEADGYRYEIKAEDEVKVEGEGEDEGEIEEEDEGEREDGGEIEEEDEQESEGEDQVEGKGEYGGEIEEEDRYEGEIEEEDEGEDQNEGEIEEEAEDEGEIEEEYEDEGECEFEEEDEGEIEDEGKGEGEDEIEEEDEHEGEDEDEDEGNGEDGGEIEEEDKCEGEIKEEDEGKGESGIAEEDEGEIEEEDEHEIQEEDEDEIEEGDEGEIADEGEGEGKGEDQDEGEIEEEDEHEIQEEDEDEGKDEIREEYGEDDTVFMKLEILNLSLLPKLGSFYSGSSTLKFPCLKQVSFTQCYNTKVFYHGDQVPKDLKVTINGDCKEGDINSLIMQQFEEERQT